MSKVKNIRKAVKFILAALDGLVSDESKLEEHQAEQWTLKDGITIVEADPFQAESTIAIVTEEGRIPLPVGDHETNDGKIIVVQVEGIIFEIKEGATEDAPAQEEVEQTEEKQVAKKTVESTTRETHFTKEEVDVKDKEIADLKIALSESETKTKESDVKLTEAITAKDKAELELSEVPAVKKINHAPASTKKKVNFRSEKKSVKGRMGENIQNILKK